MPTTTAKQMNWSLTKLVDMFGNWYHFTGMTAESCGSCKATANVGIGAGWFCPCGAYNCQSWGDHQISHRRPTYGPSRRKIMWAVKCSRYLKKCLDIGKPIRYGWGT